MTIPTTSGDPFSLEGRVAVVTGARRDIGAAIVRRFAAAGAEVALTHRGTERNERLAASLVEELGSDRVMAVIADAASGPDMTAAIEQIGRELAGASPRVPGAATRHRCRLSVSRKPGRGFRHRSGTHGRWRLDQPLMQQLPSLWQPEET